MNNPAAAVCPSCSKPIAVDYVRLGAAIRCPHCLKRTVPSVPVGGTLPLSDYALSYDDFCSLLEDSAWRTAIAPLLAEWFGATIESAGSDVWVIKAGVAIDRLWMHLQIQADKQRAITLYQRAMDLWR
jgi:hypothetical protein